MTMSGVRPGSSATSTVSPAIGRARHQPATRSTARVDVAVAGPVGVEGRGQRGDGDVVVERRDDVVAPDGADVVEDRRAWSTSDPHGDEAVDHRLGLGHHAGRRRSPAGSSSSMAPTPWPHG